MERNSLVYWLLITVSPFLSWWSCMAISSPFPLLPKSTIVQSKTMRIGSLLSGQIREGFFFLLRVLILAVLLLYRLSRGCWRSSGTWNEAVRRVAVCSTLPSTADKEPKPKALLVSSVWAFVSTLL